MSDHQKLMVLLVDDDLDVLGANSRFLRINDIDVIVAESADTALQRMAEHPVDVIVTDLRMPDCDGLAFAKQARLTAPLTPVVFFSGFAEVRDVVDAMKLGAVEFLEKPVDPDELLSLLLSIQQSHYGSIASARRAFEGLEENHPLRMRVLAYEKHLIETSLIQHRGHIASVLKALQINRRTLNDKMSRLGIKRENLLD